MPAWQAITALTVRFSVRLLSGGSCGWILLLRSAVRKACDIYKRGLCRPAFSARFLQWNWKTAATEYRRRQADSFRSTFQNQHRILRVTGSFPRGSAERVEIWIRDNGVLDAGQRVPLTRVRRIYMSFDSALAQLLGVLHDTGFYPCRIQRE